MLRPCRFILVAWTLVSAVGRPAVAVPASGVPASLVGSTEGVAADKPVSRKVLRRESINTSHSATVKSAIAIPDNAIVVAFTTQPSRMNSSLVKLVRNLRRQRVDRPLHFHLALPRTFHGEKVEANLSKLSESLSADDAEEEALVKTPVEIEWVDDVGPASRIVYAGAKYGSTHPIINVDDDTELSDATNIAAAIRSYDSIDESARSLSVHARNILSLRTGKPCLVDWDGHAALPIFENWLGVLYPPGFYQTELLEWIKTMPEYCKRSDDYFLSVWAEQRGYKVVDANRFKNRTGHGSLLEDPHLFKDYIDGDVSCSHVECTPGYCTANVVHYDRCRMYLGTTDMTQLLPHRS